MYVPNGKSRGIIVESNELLRGFYVPIIIIGTSQTEREQNNLPTQHCQIRQSNNMSRSAFISGVIDRISKSSTSTSHRHRRGKVQKKTTLIFTIVISKMTVFFPR